MFEVLSLYFWNVGRRVGTRVFGAFDLHFREVATKGLAGFLLRMLGVLLVFLLQLVLARRLGAAEFGAFSICLTMTMLVASISRAGLDLAIVKRVAVAVAEGDPETANAWLTKSLLVALVIGGGAGVILSQSSEWMATQVFRDPRLGAPLFSFAFLVPATALLFTLSEALKGLREVVGSVVSQNLIVPITVLSTLLSSPVVVDSSSTGYVYLAGTCIAATVAYAKWNATLRARGVNRLSATVVIRTGWPFFLANVGSMLLTWSDMVIAGMVASADVVAGYYAASRLATLTSIVLISVNAIAAPKFAAMHAAGDRNGLERLAKQATAMMVVMAAGPILMLVAFPDVWLGLFGDGFGHARDPLILLVFGQSVNVACGSVGLLLAMTGHERVMGRIFLAVAALTVVGSLALGNVWGITGIAVSTAVGMIGWNLWMLTAVRKNLGFWTLSTPLSWASSKYLTKVDQSDES